jgi:GxxExxY protein
MHMTENELATLVVDRCYQIHKALGPGLFESVYEEVLSYELTEAGLYFTRQTLIPVYYKNLILKLGFRADLVVEEKVIIELKSIEGIASVYKKQLLTYLKLTGLKLGLLINFNESLIKDGITRIVNNL